jgi:plastocyanin
MRGRRFLGALMGAALVLALLGAACSGTSGGNGSPSSGGGGSSSSGGVTIAMSNFSFTPPVLQLPSGQTTITLTNNAPIPHTFTLNDGSVDQVVQPGQTVTVTVNLTADAPFHCRFHPTKMTGTLQVG